MSNPMVKLKRAVTRLVNAELALARWNVDHYFENQRLEQARVVAKKRYREALGGVECLLARKITM